MQPTKYSKCSTINRYVPGLCSRAVQGYPVQAYLTVTVHFITNGQ